MLRLALERSDSSENGVEVITKLLADYGQGGICGYEDKNMAYHNSYIIADSSEAWVLETAGSLWAAKRVTSYYSISNGLTIGEEMDHWHPDLIEHAREKGWTKQVQSLPGRRRPGYIYRKYREKQNTKAGIHLP